VINKKIKFFESKFSYKKIYDGVLRELINCFMHYFLPFEEVYPSFPRVLESWWLKRLKIATS
tara:strand:+ start:334 stop:519 length:186 start_codon:yes stop_codon:yes gene_type:complete